MKLKHVFDDGRPDVVQEIATMEDLRLVIATYEALQAEVEELRVADSAHRATLDVLVSWMARNQKEIAALKKVSGLSDD